MATLAAVAAHAKVGIGTVSRVLNDSPNVSPEMRERVLRSMQEVGYTATRRRRSNSPRRAKLIGVLVTYFDEPSAYQRLRGIVSRLQPHGYEVVLFNVAAPNQVQERLLEIPQHALDGLIVISVPLDAHDGERLAAAPFPTVLVDTASPGLPSVCIDDHLGGRIATQHLVDLGHTRIGFVGEPPVNPFGFVASARREDGYRGVRAGLAASRYSDGAVDLSWAVLRDLYSFRAGEHTLAFQIVEGFDARAFARDDTERLGMQEGDNA